MLLCPFDMDRLSSTEKSRFDYLTIQFDGAREKPDFFFSLSLSLFPVHEWTFVVMSGFGFPSTENARVQWSRIFYE